MEPVLADIMQGADIGCTGSFRSPSTSSNASSAFEYGRQVTDAIASWVKKGFVFGPVELTKIPKDAKVNGIMVRPKPDGAARVILNMSAPAGNSVNDGIDITRFPAIMSSTKKWLAVLEKAGRGCVIMKIDWSDAYKHIAVRQEDLNLQWFTWLGRGFVELCLIFFCLITLSYLCCHPWPRLLRISALTQESLDTSRACIHANMDLVFVFVFGSVSLMHFTSFRIMIQRLKGADVGAF